MTKSKETTEDLWPLVHQLAAELAQRPCEKSLITQAAAYLKNNPEASFYAWLDRLARMGDLLSSGRNAGLHRREFRAACLRLKPSPTNETWPWILAWVGRLYAYYQNHRSEAQDISNVSRLRPPDSPADEFQRTPHV